MIREETTSTLPMNINRTNVEPKIAICGRTVVLNPVIPLQIRNILTGLSKQVRASVELNSHLWITPYSLATRPRRGVFTSEVAWLDSHLALVGGDAVPGAVRGRRRQNGLADRHGDAVLTGTVSVGIGGTLTGDRHAVLDVHTV